MKCLLSIIASFSLIFALALPASATNTNDYGTEKTISKDGFSFTIYEKTTDNYTTIRTYENTAPATRSEPDLEKTKALLSVLGLNEERIEGLPQSTLLDYANSDSISISTSYVMSNKSTGQITYLPKDVAVSDAQALDAEITDYRIAMARSGQMPNESDVPGEFLDSYMEITHSAISLRDGDGGYRFTTDATWLTMPWFRGNDSIGSCTLGATFTPNTAEGYYGYDISYIMPNGDIDHDSDEHDITDNQHKTTDGWNGYAGIFNLPNDGVNTLYDNLYAHYEYCGHVGSPDESRWFNSIATYDHSLLTVNFDPSISIDTSGDVSASIGISLDVSADSRNAELEVHYVP